MTTIANNIVGVAFLIYYHHDRDDCDDCDNCDPCDDGDDDGGGGGDDDYHDSYFNANTMIL